MIYLYNIILKILFSFILKLEYKREKQINERSSEYSFCLKHISKYCDGDVLDIGSGKSSFPHLLSVCGFNVTAIDKIDGYWKSVFNRHYKIIKDDIVNSKLERKFQFITCISVLEHIEYYKDAINGMYDLLEDGGYLVLTVPYNEKHYFKNIYKHENAGYGKNSRYATQIFSRDEVNEWLEGTSFEIIEQEYYKVFTGRLWTFGERIAPVLKTYKSRKHHLICILLKKLNVL